MMENPRALPRRLLLRGAAAGAVVGGLAGVGVFPAPALAAPDTDPWAVASNEDLETIRIPGTDVSVTLRGGDVAVVLGHLVSRFHYGVEALHRGEVVGVRPPRAHLARHEAHHASGTAVDIRAAWYPLGAASGFFPHQQEVIRDILAECEGVVRWGSDLALVDEAHFQIDVPPGDARLRRVAAKVRGWAGRPGAGAGVLIDPLVPARRNPALALARRQRRR